VEALGAGGEKRDVSASHAWTLNGMDSHHFTAIMLALAVLAFPRVAWRCHDAAFFKKLTAFLAAHHVRDETIYSYALLHNDSATLREWILHRNDFVAACGPYLSTTLDGNGFFVLEVVKAWIDPAVKNPRTIHHFGSGNFMIAGDRIRLKSKMK